MVKKIDLRYNYGDAFLYKKINDIIDALDVVEQQITSLTNLEANTIKVKVDSNGELHTSIWRTDFNTNFNVNKQVLFYVGGSQFPYLDWAYPEENKLGCWKYEDIEKWCYLEDLLKLAP